jgi:Protein of unknown function (DUF2804)
VPLPLAPDTLLDELGRPRFGSYQGALGKVSWQTLAPARGAIWTRLHKKRWHYAGAVSEQAFCAMAVVDLGWVSSAFVYVFERRTRRLLCDLSFLGAPFIAAHVAESPHEGASSSFAFGGGIVRIQRAGREWRIAARARDLELDASFAAEPAPPSLCAIAPIDGGVANCTHKAVGLPVVGTARVGRTTLSLDGGYGALDQTNGLLARDTSWRWASATSRDVGLNLSDGFMGTSENVVWSDGALHPVGRARFEFDADDPERPWNIRTDDGAVDLVFTPEGHRRQDKHLGVAISRYVQPFGRFSGTLVGKPVTDLPGVTEDHVARW